MDCLFCKIANHEIPADVKFEDKNFIAFGDINPQAKIHILIIPKKHISSVSTLADEDANTIGQMVLIARNLAKELQIDKRGYRLVLNSGADAGQAVDHIHLHLLGGNTLGPIA